MSGKKTAPENETKSEKFRRLANGRVKVAIGACGSIGKLGTNAYDYDDAATDKLHAAIVGAANAMRDRLKSRGNSGGAVGDVL